MSNIVQHSEIVDLTPSFENRQSGPQVSQKAQIGDTRSLAPLHSCADGRTHPLTSCADGRTHPLTSCAAHSIAGSTGSLRANRLPSPLFDGAQSRLSTINSLAITIRPATLADVPFIDRLQKKQSKQVGWFSTKTIEGKIQLGHVLIAEVDSSELIVDRKDEAASGLSTINHQPSTPAPAGYLIGNDRYHKRDELGCIFQINVDPAYRRHLVAARLLKAQFDRSAYGCRLYCCWCAQDIEANRFWESMGFVPLAFRAGSRKRDRVHIFWQKRIRAGDDGDPSKGGTPWWFPSLTGGGSLREDRIVLPIPPGVRWDEEMPRVLPRSEGKVDSGKLIVDRTQAESSSYQPSTSNHQLSAASRQDGESASRASNRKSDLSSRNSLLSSSTGRLRFFGAKVKKQKPARRVIKFTPQQMAMSRELRDRWQEQVNARLGEALVALPAPKYQIARSEPTIEPTPPLLEAA